MVAIEGSHASTARATFAHVQTHYSVARLKIALPATEAPTEAILANPACSDTNSSHVISPSNFSLLGYIHRMFPLIP